VLWLHALPNASAALLNVIGINVIYLFGGVIVVESVFAYPGLGTLLVAGINQKDVPVIGAVAMIMAFWIILVNLGVDALVLALNPRLRLHRG
jgi:peptide/nickel transport system permease protein